VGSAKFPGVAHVPRERSTWQKLSVLPPGRRGSRLLRQRSDRSWYRQARPSPRCNRSTRRGGLPTSRGISDPCKPRHCQVPAPRDSWKTTATARARCWHQVRLLKSSQRRGNTLVVLGSTAARDHCPIPPPSARAERATAETSDPVATFVSCQEAPTGVFGVEYCRQAPGFALDRGRDKGDISRQGARMSSSGSGGAPVYTVFP